LQCDPALAAWQRRQINGVTKMKAIKFAVNSKGKKFALCHSRKAFANADHTIRFAPAFSVMVLKTNHEHGMDRTRWCLVVQTIDRAEAEMTFSKRTSR
jgi:hypothetical protein